MTWEHLPEPNRYVRSLTQSISGVPNGAPEPLFLGESESQFVVTLTGEQWRRLYDCVLLGADILYPDEAHEVMFSWLKQVEWPTECGEEEVGYQLYVPPTDIAYPWQVRVFDIPQTHAHMRITCHALLDTEEVYGDLRMQLNLGSGSSYALVGEYQRNTAAAVLVAQQLGDDTQFSFEQVLPGSGHTSPYNGIVQIDFPHYSVDAADWNKSGFLKANYHRNIGQIVRAEYHWVHAYGSPITDVLLWSDVGTLTGYYSVELFGMLPG